MSRPGQRRAVRAEGSQSTTPDRYRVGSVAKAAAVLECVAAGPVAGSSLTEIAVAVGMSKSACFALLHTLLAHGLLVDAGEGQLRRYLLGSSMIRLGNAARSQMSIVPLAGPVLAALAIELNSSVRLGVLDGTQISIVDRVDPPSGLRIDLGMGQTELLHCTAVGKAVLASMPVASATALLAATQPLTIRTAHTLTSVDAVCTDLERVRRRGFAVDNEEDFVGIMCFGAAIVDHAGQVAGAITTTCVKASLTGERATDIGTAVARAAARVSARLGHPGAP